MMSFLGLGATEAKAQEVKAQEVKAKAKREASEHQKEVFAAEKAKTTQVEAKRTAMHMPAHKTHAEIQKMLAANKTRLSKLTPGSVELGTAEEKLQTFEKTPTHGSFKYFGNDAKTLQMQHEQHIGLLNEKDQPERIAELRKQQHNFDKVDVVPAQTEYARARQFPQPKTYKDALIQTEVSHTPARPGRR